MHLGIKNDASVSYNESLHWKKNLLSFGTAPELPVCPMADTQVRNFTQA